MGFNEQELLVIKSALRFYDEQLVSRNDVDKIIDKVDFWIALERQDYGYELDDDYFNFMNI